MPNEVMKSLTIGANTYDLPQKTSDLINDNGYTTFSGSYNDLTNKPTIHTYSAGNGIDITNDTISAKNVMYVTFTVTYNENNGTYTVSNVSKTFSEIYAHLQNGGIAIAIGNNETYYIKHYNVYEIAFQCGGSILADECYLNIGDILYIFSDNTFDYYDASSGYMPYLYLNGAQTQHLPNFYAPTTSGTSGQILKSNGNGQAPTWTTLNVESPITYTNNIIGFDGYDVTTTTHHTLCNETVTTSLDEDYAYVELAYSNPIDADPIKVTFNGVEYIYSRRVDDNGYYSYGAIKPGYVVDFSEYPFGLVSDTSGNILYTKNTGTYTIKIETITDNIMVSSDFAKARGYSIVENPSQILVNESTTTASSGYTYGEGTLSYFSESNDVIKVTFDNVEYICPKKNYEYGAHWDLSSDSYDFSTYPFSLQPQDLGSDRYTHIVTQTAGTHTVKIENYPKVAILTDDFKQAIKSSFPGDVMIQGVDYVTAGQKAGSSRGPAATAEGWSTTASGESSHAEGSNTTASGNQSHAEGASTTASGYYSHAEGSNTTASDFWAHAEGSYTTASGAGSHAEGNRTTASGRTSHAEGVYTTANHKSQHVFGEYNILDTSTATADNRGNYVEIVGKGTSTSARSNARTLDWNGNEVLAGKLTVGTGPTANMDVATKQYVDNAVAAISVPQRYNASTNPTGYLTMSDLPLYDGSTSNPT